MTLLETPALSLLVGLNYITAVLLLGLAQRNASIVEVFWGLGFVLLAALYFIATDGYVGRKALITALVAAWGVRLSAYILWRNWGKGEDYRYRTGRGRAGAKFWWASL